MRRLDLTAALISVWCSSISGKGVRYNFYLGFFRRECREGCQLPRYFFHNGRTNTVVTCGLSNFDKRFDNSGMCG